MKNKNILKQFSPFNFLMLFLAGITSAFGITIIKARGYYSDENKTLIYFVVNRFQG